MKSDNSSNQAKGNESFNVAMAYQQLGDLPNALKYYELAYDCGKNKEREKAVLKTRDKINEK